MPPIKRRYILFQMEPVSTTKDKFLIHEGEIVNTVRESVHRLHGDFGLASIQLNFHSKKFDLATRTGVLVAKRESYRFLLTTLPLIKSIRDQPITISILKVTGTLRACRRALQGHHGNMIYKLKKSLASRKKSDLNEESMREKISQGIQSIVDSLDA